MARNQTDQNCLFRLELENAAVAGSEDQPLDLCKAADKYSCLVYESRVFASFLAFAPFVAVIEKMRAELTKTAPEPEERSYSVVRLISMTIWRKIFDLPEQQQDYLSSISYPVF